MELNQGLTHIAALYAALLGLLGAALTINVIRKRVAFKVDAGDGGNPALAQAIRAHANFAEQTPLALLLILCAEATGASAIVLHGLGAALLFARLANAWGLSHSLGATMQRQVGAGLTLLVIGVSALVTLYNLGFGR